MSAELIPIKTGQHQVVLVPRTTTDLPFFYLTKQKATLKENIDYEGVDNYGNPVLWKVTPNRDPAIGEPAIEAHEVWHRLVKPTIDEKLNYAKASQDIIPLGKLRECLRITGWREGGWRAQQLIKALRQIGAAWCIADLWIPTTKKDENGKIVFEHINAEFSRMSIYAIGKKHLTDAQLKEGNFNFDFDLDDTVYIQLHPIEVQIQREQLQKYIDNQYLFSVKPSARRWYELLAAKIYGVVKNKGAYCEIKYSWYVKHHHTLKRHYTQKMVVKQMGQILQEHIDTGYLSKVEFRKIKEPDQEIDWIIRYYPGEAAKESIARILSHQFNKRKLENKEKVSVKAAPEKPVLSTQPEAEQGTSEPIKGFEQIPIDRSLVDQKQQLTTRLIIEFGMTERIAEELVTNFQAETLLQLEAFPYRKGTPSNKAGFIKTAIENSYLPPQEFLDYKAQTDSQAKLAAAAQAIASCPLHCSQDGYRRVGRKTDLGRMIPAMRRCSHNPEIEAQFADYRD